MKVCFCKSFGKEICILLFSINIAMSTQVYYFKLIQTHIYVMGTSLQYSCLENHKDRGAWQAIVHGVVKRQTQLSKEVKDMVERKISQCV